MAKRIVTKIGDVFCVEFDNKYKRYFQYFCNDITQLNSSVIRVFKNIYPIDYSPILGEIISDEVDFYAHTILRVGLEWESWYKIGKVKGNYTEDIEIPIFGTCQETEYINREIIDVDPNTNWYIWKINRSPIRVGTLTEKLINNVERGGVFPCEEIVDRMKYGYYRWNSAAYNTLKRRPYPYVDTYLRNKIIDDIQYLHFKGEDVVQKLKLKKDGPIIIEEGHPLSLPKFWETNWDVNDFITAEEFNEVWDKYTKKN